MSAQEELSPSIFDEPERIILTLVGGLTRYFAQGHKERLYIQITLSDDWALVYKLGKPDEPGEPAPPRTASSSTAAPVRTFSTHFLATLDPLDISPPNYIECIPLLTTLRHNIGLILRTVAVEQMGRMVRTSAALDDLAERATRMRRESDEVCDKEREVCEELKKSIVRFWDSRKEAKEVMEELLQEILMLVIFSKGP
ncbi:hypothetical protein JCM11251_001596 [Rhodosporidiobolus azoricus]